MKRFLQDWPKCLTEEETLSRMLEGQSLARFGDGELIVALGGGIPSHRSDKRMSEELCEILINPADGCLPAIPTMDPNGPLIRNWARHKDRFKKVLDLDRVYGSAFVGKKACAPWIDNDLHVERLTRLWRGKRVVSVCGPVVERLEAVLRKGAASVQYVPCPPIEAYSRIDAIEQDCLSMKPELVVVCAGVMATALANRLAGHGIQTIDLGRGLGLIWRRKGHA